MGYGGKDISDWVDEITAWGKSKGWDEPALCKKKGGIVVNKPDNGVRRRSAPEGVNHDAVLAKLALVMTELSEAVEEAREDRWLEWNSVEKPDKPEGFVVELADAVIRIFHLAGLLGLDLEGAIRTKMEYNRTRPYRHGGKKA